MSAVDSALLAKLHSASAVTSSAPGGVWMDVAPSATTGIHVIVELQAHTDEDSQSGGHHEVGRYLVKAVGVGTNAAGVSAAAAAIHAALQLQALTITGYAHMITKREERVRYVEPDGDLRYQHMGGIYAVWASAP